MLFRSELLAAISSAFEKLMADLARVPEKDARKCTLDGHATGTTMSPADLVAYLIGWNELVLKWLEQDDRGAEVDFPETGYKWNQFGLLAQKFYRDYQSLSYSQLLERLTRAKGSLVVSISARSDDELYGATWYDKWTKGRMIQFNSSSPYVNARGRIRKWLKGVEAQNMAALQCDQ